MSIINSYSFGKIIVDGKVYTSDCIILPDKIESNWWRKHGHKLSLDDLKCCLNIDCDAIIIGTGAYDCMKVEDEVNKYFNNKGVEVIIKPTDEAYKIYNEMINKKKVIGAFHLTC